MKILAIIIGLFGLAVGAVYFHGPFSVQLFGNVFEIEVEDVNIWTLVLALFCCGMSVVMLRRPRSGEKKPGQKPGSE